MLNQLEGEQVLSLVAKVGVVLRHSFVPHVRMCCRRGYDIRTVQKLLGHLDVSTTMIYHCVESRGQARGSESVGQGVKTEKV